MKFLRQYFPVLAIYRVPTLPALDNAHCDRSLGGVLRGIRQSFLKGKPRYFVHLMFSVEHHADESSAHAADRGYGNQKTFFCSSFHFLFRFLPLAFPHNDVNLSQPRFFSHKLIRYCRIQNNNAEAYLTAPFSGCFSRRQNRTPILSRWLVSLSVPPAQSRLISLVSSSER